MKAGALISKAVVQVDNDLITFRYVDNGVRPLAVDAHCTATEHAIRICCDPSDIPIVGDRGGVGEAKEYEATYCIEKVRQGKRHYKALGRCRSRDGGVRGRTR